MTRDRLVSLFVVLTAVALVVLVWALVHRHSRTVVRPETTVLVEPPLTPLRDSGPRNNGRAGKAKTRRSGSSLPGATPRASSPLARQNRPLSPHRRRKAKTPRRRRRSPQRPYTPGQPTNPAPPPPQRPPVDVQLPAPLTVCARPTGGVNCP